VTYADSVDEALSAAKDLRIALWVPEEFVELANNMTAKALAEHGKADHAPPLKIVLSEDDVSNGPMALWTLDAVLNWQMLDRRIDE
jgi:hypothetical protein